MDDPKVYDVNGAARDLAWLAAQYDGCHIERGPAGTAFRIVTIQVTEGPAAFVAQVLGATGAPLMSQPVAFSWPSLSLPSGELPDLSGCGAPKIWTARGVYQRTDGNGLTGFGLGTSYGPFYQGWVISPSRPSDCIVGSGMKGGTNHRGPLRVTWQLLDDAPVVVNPPPPPGPGPNPTPVTGDLAETNALLREIRDVLKGAFNR